MGRGYGNSSMHTWSPHCLPQGAVRAATDIYLNIYIYPSYKTPRRVQQEGRGLTHSAAGHGWGLWQCAALPEHITAAEILQIFATHACTALSSILFAGMCWFFVLFFFLFFPKAIGYFCGVCAVMHFQLPCIGRGIPAGCPHMSPPTITHHSWGHRERGVRTALPTSHHQPGGGNPPCSSTGKASLTRANENNQK